MTASLKSDDDSQLEKWRWRSLWKKPMTETLKNENDDGHREMMTTRLRKTNTVTVVVRDMVDTTRDWNFQSRTCATSTTIFRNPMSWGKKGCQFVQLPIETSRATAETEKLGKTHFLLIYFLWKMRSMYIIFSFQIHQTEKSTLKINIWRSNFDRRTWQVLSRTVASVWVPSSWS